MDASGLLGLIVGFGSPPTSNNPESALAILFLSGLLSLIAVAIGYFISRTIVNRIDSASFLSKKGKTAIMVILPFAYILAAILLSVIIGLLIFSLKAS